MKLVGWAKPVSAGACPPLQISRVRRSIGNIVPPSVLRLGAPFATRRSTESDGALLLVDAGTHRTPSEPMVFFSAVVDVYRLRTVAR